MSAMQTTQYPRVLLKMTLSRREVVGLHQFLLQPEKMLSRSHHGMVSIGNIDVGTLLKPIDHLMQ